MDAVDLALRPLTIYNDLIEIQTEERLQFVDLTEWVGRSLARSGVEEGFAQIRVLHTTAAIVINENEPLLLGDFKSLLERLVPEGSYYAHDDPLLRRANLQPGERANGHAHARALFLGESKQVNVVEGRAELGRWQSILLVELDGPRKRTISLALVGHRRNIR
jgi:secondary thiamine-phosphate synthase enzyme